MTITEVSAWLHQHYADDIAQEAVLLTLAKPRRDPAAYARAMARILANIGYSDGRITYARRNSWTCEGLSGLGLDQDETGKWMPGTRTPEAIAIAREALARLPPWLIQAHLEDDYVYRRACGHGAQWLYPYRSEGYLAVRCQLCIAQRQAQTRQSEAP